MIRIEQIISEFKSYNPNADVSPLQKAYILAARLLASPSGLVAQPIAEHLEVAHILVGLKLDIESIVSGLLYSTIKEHRTSAAELSGHIGEATAKIVEALDALPGWTGERTGKDEMAEAMRELVLAASQDPRVIFIKLAVRLVRLRHWSSILRQKSKGFGSETLEIFAPLAERLGLNHLKVELEDRAFALIHPKEFQAIQKFLESQREAHLAFLQALQEELLRLLALDHIEAVIHNRIKHSFSIYQKARKYDVHYQDIHDLLGLRILTKSKDEAYKVLGLVHGRFNPVHGRFKDYIAFPKANGYQSLHTMVLNDQGTGFEVQIRTEEMHHVAELGVAAHWSYKAALPKAEKSNSSLAWLNELSQSLGIAADPKESLEIFTRELYSDLVYAYSPKGKIIKLPAGSTVLDFAYAIHTDLGNRCIGAKIDGRILPVQHRLHHGDQVSILTSEEAHPTQSWLAYARTTRALSQIRQGLRKRENKEALKLGREIFVEQIQRFEIPLDEFSESAEFQGFLLKHGYEDAAAYWTQMGFGNASMNELKAYLLSINEHIPQRQSRKLVLPFQRKVDVVEIPGLEDIQVRIAKCCAPIHGDAISGLMIQGEGVSVHQTDCKYLTGIDPKRLVEAQWVLRPEDRKTVKVVLHFDADIKTHVQIMRIFASAKVVLQECHHRLVENRSTQEVICQVASLDQLAKILKRLNNLNPVTARRVFDSPEEEAVG
ncbi:MAG: RelA/SpoT family protein [bacterium]|nr:RelA/SpoT family protein [bacterium]